MSNLSIDRAYRDAQVKILEKVLEMVRHGDAVLKHLEVRESGGEWSMTYSMGSIPRKEAE